MKYVTVSANMEPENQRKIQVMEQRIQKEGWFTMKEKNEEIKNDDA
ncbi:hypothetical protein [Ferroplasma acidiphilum]|nr:hypothetical protein [Ferroplasma acidiphilum]WMT52312.1 MAG: hypothetical protein RE473_04680 [Ferroplasma acidiphilum]